MDPSAITAQQSAIASVRTHYERGEISYETLRHALDTIVAARSAEECDAIVRELPISPLAALAALDVSSPRTPTTAQPQSIVAVMAQTTKLRRPWELQSDARVTAVMGGVQLDVGRAKLPPRATIRVRAVLGEVTLYLPSSAQVTVRSRVYLGSSAILGEGTSGVAASSHEQHRPAAEPASVGIEIEALTVMGSLRVLLSGERPALSIRELVRDTLAVVVKGFRRGLLQDPQPIPRRHPRVDAPLPAPDTWEWLKSQIKW
jgi:hypothetical protein